MSRQTIINLVPFLGILGVMIFLLIVIACYHLGLSEWTAAFVGLGFLLVYAFGGGHVLSKMMVRASR